MAGNARISLAETFRNPRGKPAKSRYFVISNASLANAARDAKIAEIFGVSGLFCL
jgi:hypothetical protein